MRTLGPLSNQNFCFQWAAAREQLAVRIRLTNNLEGPVHNSSLPSGIATGPNLAKLLKMDCRSREWKTLALNENGLKEKPQSQTTVKFASYASFYFPPDNYLKFMTIQICQLHNHLRE